MVGQVLVTWRESRYTEIQRNTQCEGKGDEAAQEKEKREKSKRKTRKKLTSIKGAGGGTSNEDGVIDIRPGPRLVKKRGGAVMKSRGGTFKGTFQ